MVCDTDPLGVIVDSHPIAKSSFLLATAWSRSFNYYERWILGESFRGFFYPGRSSILREPHKVRYIFHSPLLTLRKTDRCNDFFFFFFIPQVNMHQRWGTPLRTRQYILLSRGLVSQDFCLYLFLVMKAFIESHIQTRPI